MCNVSTNIHSKTIKEEIKQNNFRTAMVHWMCFQRITEKKTITKTLIRIGVIWSYYHYVNK